MSGKSNVLIYGAGVIGSIYAVNFANAGHDVFVYARGNRLHSLENKGLLYTEKNSVKKAPVTVLDKVDHMNTYDYVFVAVRYEQIETALAELATTNNTNIVTMVNNPKGYVHWESLIGKGRLIPAFPGAGGKIEDDVLHYALTPKIIQTTTFGEAGGTVTNRLMTLAQLFKSSQIPYSISNDMDAWQKSHLALVIPLANGIYYDGGNIYTTAKNKKAIRMMSVALRKSFNSLKAKGIPITPTKLNIFCFCPLWLVQICLKIFCKTKLAETVSSHVPYIREEMAMLDKAFDEIVHTE
jgi:2-dehydropantoate 2-reductase